MGNNENPCENLIPMGKWIAEPEGEDECRSCLLGPVTQWYSEILKENNKTEIVDRLEALVKRPDVTPEELCQEFDNIKMEVPEDIRERLLDFDCSAQCYYNPDKEGGD